MAVEMTVKTYRGTLAKKWVIAIKQLAEKNEEKIRYEAQHNLKM